MANKCIICGKCCGDGIIIKGQKICDSCEINIVNCKNSTDFYNYYKKIIEKNIVPKIEKSFLQIKQDIR